MEEVSTTIHNSNEKMSTEPQASISKPRDTSLVNPQLDKVDSPNDDDIISDISYTDDQTPPGTLKRGLRRQLRDIEPFGASVVIADIGTNDLSPSSLDPMKLAEDIVEYLREISELPGVAAVVILTITPRSEEFNYNHHAFILYKYSADLRTLICENAPSGREDELRGDREPRKVRHVRNQQVGRFTVPLPVSPRLTLAGDLSFSRHV